MKTMREIGIMIVSFAAAGSLFLGASLALAFPPSTVAQGGTGVNAIATGTIVFGQGSNLIGNGLYIGTSSNLTFSTTTNALSFLQGSTSIMSILGPIYIGTSTASTTIWGSNSTSTFAGGINIPSSAGGCFAIGGTCLTQNVGTITGVTAGTGLTGGGSSGSVTLSLSVPVSIANGGTNATSFTTTGNSIYWDGTRLATALTTTKVTTPYASSTAITASGETGIPNAASSPTLSSGDIALDTTAASSSLRFGDGSATRTLFTDITRSIIFASSTLSYINSSYGASGSTTIEVLNSFRPLTMLSIACYTDTGTVWVAFGNGTATTTAVNCANTVATVSLSTNNTFTMLKNVFVEIGHTGGTAPNVITVSSQVRQDAD